MTEQALNKDEIKSVLRGYIVEEFLPGESPESLTDGVRLFTDGVLDSLASLKLVSFMEERFGVRIEAHEVDVDHLDSLDAVADLIKAKLG
jgi:acyl carrier protein